MFCNQCGKQMPDNANVCPYCGKPVNQQYPQPNTPMQRGQTPGGAYPQFNNRARIDNIFSSLVHDRNVGAGMEFALWCAVCALAVLSLIAAVTVDLGVGYSGPYRTLWIFLMILQLGLGTGMVFRKIKPIVMLASVIIFQFIMVIPYYLTITGLIDDMTDSVPGILTAFFIILLLLGAGLTACAAIQFFSRFRMGIIVSILSMSSVLLTFVMALCMYLVPHSDSKEFEKYSGYAYEGASFALGSISFVGTGVILAIFISLFFFGVIENKKDKIYVIQSGTGRVQAFNPGLQCIQGSYMGQVFYLQGQELTMGTAPGVNLLFQDAYISHRHCSIRFNMLSGQYEILDTSSNGVFLSNGMRLQKGTYSSVQRGSVIWIGSMGQQFRLL